MDRSGVSRTSYGQIGGVTMAGHAKVGLEILAVVFLLLLM